METDDKKYEVTLSVRLHGAFTVLAADESCAEEIVNRMFAEGEIKLGDLEFADETRVDCTGESEPNAKAVNEDGGDVDAITASTITSRAYSLAVDNAVKAFNSIKGE